MQENRLPVRPGQFPERWVDPYLVDVMHNALETGDVPVVHAFVREYIRRYGSAYRLSDPKDPRDQKQEISASFP